MLLISFLAAGLIVLAIRTVEDGLLLATRLELIICLR